MAGVVKGQGWPTVDVRVSESRFVRTLIVDACPFCGLTHFHTGGLSSEPLDSVYLREVAAGCSGRTRYDAKTRRHEPVEERRYVLRLPPSLGAPSDPAGVEGNG